MDSVNPLIGLCSLLPIWYFSAFAHELGHAIMADTVGFAVTSFGLGVGRPFVVFSLGRTQIYFCRTKPLQGISFCVPPQLIPPRRQMIPYLAGGIIANTLLALIALALYRWLPWGRSVSLPACAVNAILAVVNLVPFYGRIGKASLRTDGGQILQILRDRVISVPAPQVIQALYTFREFWLSIHNHTMLRIYILGSASAYAEMNDFVLGDLILSELEPLDPSDLPTVQAREAMVRGAIHCGAGRLDRAEQALVAADALFQATGDDGGRLFTAMQRLWLRIARGDMPGALGDLGALHSHRLYQRSSWIQASVHAFCVQAHAAASNALGAEQALVSYESMRKRQPSAWRDLQVYRALARLRVQDEDWVRAELAYRRAVAAIDELARSCPDAEDRRGFLERQSPLLDEVRRCYHQLNRAEEGERLIAPVISAEHIEQRLDEERRRRLLRLGRVGRWTLLIDVCCAMGLIMSLIFVRFVPTHPLAVGGIFFILCTFFSILLSVLCWLIGLIVPRLRSSCDLVTFILAGFPWLALLTGLVTTLGTYFDRFN